MVPLRCSTASEPTSARDLASLLLRSSCGYWNATAPRRADSRAAWIPVIAALWANVHISWYVGFLLLGSTRSTRWLGGARHRRAARAPVALGCGVAGQPYGAETLASVPLRAHWRTIDVRGDRRVKPRRGARRRASLFVWPILPDRARATLEMDLAEAGACLAFTALALGSNRLVATYAWWRAFVAAT